MYLYSQANLFVQRNLYRTFISPISVPLLIFTVSSSYLPSIIFFSAFLFYFYFPSSYLCSFTSSLLFFLPLFLLVGFPATRDNSLQLNRLIEDPYEVRTHRTEMKWITDNYHPLRFFCILNIFVDAVLITTWCRIVGKYCFFLEFILLTWYSNCFVFIPLHFIFFPFCPIQCSD